MITVHDFSTNDLWRLRVSRPGRADLYLQETADHKWDWIMLDKEGTMVGKVGVSGRSVEAWLRARGYPKLDTLLDQAEGM